MPLASAGLGLTMSPQVKVSYFRQYEDSALGHSVLYLTGVGMYRLPGSPRIPAHPVSALRVLGEP